MRPMSTYPRIGHAWMPKGQQAAIPTPGKNQKRYLAGALNSLTGQVVWVADEKKNSLVCSYAGRIKKNLSSGQTNHPYRGQLRHSQKWHYSLLLIKQSPIKSWLVTQP